MRTVNDHGCMITLHVGSPNMDNITCKNITVGLVEAYPFCHQTLHLITVKQSIKNIATLKMVIDCSEYT